MNAAELNLNPLTQIDPIVIMAIIVVFVATYFALRHFFVYPYLAVMEERERLFEVADDTERAVPVVDFGPPTERAAG